MYALLLGNKVMDVAENQFEVHKSMSWVDCPDEVKIGWILKDGSFIDPNLKTEEQILTLQSKKTRIRRNHLLKESDWTQVPDAPVDQQAWAEYRQALRDVPQQTGFPTDINWPTKPE